YAQKKVGRPESLRPGECMREEDCITCRNIGDWDSAPNFFFRARFGNIDIVSQRRAAKNGLVDLGHTMLSCSQHLYHATGGFNFSVMTLPVIEGKRIRFIAVSNRDGHRGG